MTTCSTILTTIYNTIYNHPVLFFYILLALVNSMSKSWDGFYNFFYRFTHLLLNAPQVQAFESKHSISVEPLPQAPTTPNAPTKISREAPPLAKVTEEKSVLTRRTGCSSVVGGTL